MANKNRVVKYTSIALDKTFLNEISTQRNAKRYVILQNASSQAMGALGEHYADVAIENFTIYPQTFDGIYKYLGQDILADVKTTKERSTTPYSHLDGKQKVLARHGFTFVVVMIHATKKTMEVFLINPDQKYSQLDLRKNLNYFAEFTPKDMNAHMSNIGIPTADESEITPAKPPVKSSTPKKRKRVSTFNTPIKALKIK